MHRKTRLVTALVASSLLIPLAQAGVSGTSAAAPAAPRNAPGGSFESRMEKLYSDIENEYRPEVRWWLAEGLNTDETLRKNVQEIADSGFGAAEFLAMPEPGAEDEIYGWGSQEWTSDSQLVISEATKQGLGFSLTSGTHWATANLPDTYEWDGATFDPDNRAASKELDYATVRMAAGQRFNDVLPQPVKPTESADTEEETFQGVVAAKLIEARPDSGQDHDFQEGAGTGVIDFDSLTDLSDQVVASGDEHRLDWTAPSDGEYVLLSYWMHGTGEKFDPSVSNNYTINYVDHDGVDALKAYWEENVLTPELKEQIRENGRGEIYMDSLELASYGAAGVLWGYDFKDEFKKRRGYDVTPYLPLISWDKTRHDSNNPPVFDYAVADDADQARVQKIRNDVNQTFSELYEQNVLAPLQSWLHGLGMQLRAEPSYGMVYEISTPAKYLDDVETETFAHNGDLDVYRGMLGGANMYGRTFSSETGAVGGKNYYYNMDYWTRIAYLQFVGGVSRTVFHGYSAIEGSEADTKWPGHEGMYTFFSDRFNSRQPASTMYPAWTEMLGRNQKILRQGQPQRDVAILRTDNAFISYGQPRANTPAENSYFMNDKPYFWKNLDLQHAGYTYDYFSPQLLEDESNTEWSSDELQPDGPAYQAMVLYQDSLELSSAKRILEIAQDGLPVLFVNNTSEIRSHNGPDIEYEEAAAKSRFGQDSDADVAAVVAQIKHLPNVRTVDEQSEAMGALQDLGVEPRVSYGEANDKIMTISRLDHANEVLYTFAYNFKFEKNKAEAPYSFDLSLDAEGKPYTIDDWTGDVEPVGTWSTDRDHTTVPLTLKPGEATVVALDLSDRSKGVHAVSTTADGVVGDGGQTAIRATQTGNYTTVLSNGRTVRTHVNVPARIPLSAWDITVQDWNEGEQVINTETKFGHTTREAWFTTKTTDLHFPDSSLAPWKDLSASAEQLAQLTGPDAAMSDVSGIGTYQTTFEIPASWRAETGAYFRVGSLGGSLAQVSVNGQPAVDLDPRTLQVDISDLVKAGTNTIEVVVPTTLTNRMLKRGYGTAGPAQDYGMTGEVSIVPFTTTRLPNLGGGKQG